MIHQKIKENVKDLLDTKEYFLKIRNLLLNDLLPIVRNSNEITLERISFCISNMIMIGCVRYWPDCLEDILNFAKSSKENCFIATIILENIEKEINDTVIGSNMKKKIKDFMSDNSILIQNFVLVLLNEIEKEDKLDLSMFERVIKLMKAWTKYGINLLKIPNLAKFLMNNINSENIESISEIFCESFTYSKNAKYYATHEEYDINKIIEEISQDELESIINVLFMIKEYLNQYKDDEDIFNGLANIFTTITENFVFLIFAEVK
jgi:hypothetical protein